MTLTEFLLARIAEDEAAATVAPFDHHWTAHPDEVRQPIKAGGKAHVATCAKSVMAHIARHDPARVLAECEAKRRIVADHDDQHDCPGWGTASAWPYVGCSVLRLLALPFADHPDYRPEWKR
jgi:hypothetical protein